ncbi:MAG: tRNA 2-thiouridine(34) synthase MnmA [Bacteroidales bacterium]|nr:tRNA 2-thiouridine(34) synthase MnmA [Bacteroidales bacterium]
MYKKILVGLSGGVDSLSVALFLRKQGYEVVGAMLEMFAQIELDSNKIESSSSKIESSSNKIESSSNKFNSNYAELIEYADKIGVEVYYIDTKKKFEDKVINHFCKSYIDGITPNICVHCNQNVKIPTLIELAKELSCDYVATGHYARIRKEGERYVLYQALDTWKDQSYMLHRLSQEQLSKLILPLGNYKKEDIKTYMRENGFEDFANKRESYGVCFLGEETYKDFLLRRNPELSNLKQGKIINENNEFVGTHDGYPFYTIGQYKSLKTTLEGKQYINSINYKDNILKVGDKSSCYKQNIIIKDINFIKYKSLLGDYSFRVKIRGKDEGTLANIKFLKDRAEINFTKPIFAPMQGQSIVIYENNDIVCGGEIL